MRLLIIAVLTVIAHTVVISVRLQSISGCVIQGGVWSRSGLVRSALRFVLH